MSKPKRKRKRPGHGSGPAPVTAESVLDELEAKAIELTEGDPDHAGPLWGAVHKLLLKAKADPAESGRLIATRDAGEIMHLVRRLRGEEEAPPPVEEPEAPAGADVPPEEMKKAMRAFRKRIKLVRLDHESKLGVGPMTGGRKADFDAIMAPQEFPPEVWQALVATGQLEAAGPGFYMLAEGE